MPLLYNPQKEDQGLARGIIRLIRNRNRVPLIQTLFLHGF